MLYRKLKPVLIITLSACALTACVTTTATGERTSKKNSEASEINVRLGLEYMRKGNLRLAQDKLERAVEYDPSSADANASLALLYEEIGDDKKAARYYRSAVHNGSDEPGISNMYGSFLCRQEQYKKAEKYFVIAADNPFFNNRELPYANAGICLMSIPEYEQAEIYLRKALEFNDDYAPALFHLAKLNYEVGVELQGRAFVERYLDQVPEDPSALLLAYQIERRLGDYQAAQSYSSRLKNEFPTSEQTRDVIIAERGDSDSGN